MPAQTRIIHFYVCLGAAGGKECEVIMPGLLPLAATGIYYKLLQKKTNVILMIIGTAIFGIICAQFGILAA